MPDLSGFDLLSLHPTVAFMGVKGYKFFHGAAPFFLVFCHYKTGSRVALSYFHSGESQNPEYWMPAYAGMTDTTLLAAGQFIGGPCPGKNRGKEISL
jgi:hypothetical protein